LIAAKRAKRISTGGARQAEARAIPTEHAPRDAKFPFAAAAAAVTIGL
jgi:hypothetical protein